MIRTRVGYAGGTLKNPNYHNLGDHSESIQIDYDPAEISYERLLDIFWSTHNPCAQPYGRQYMSAIFTHNDEQRKLALASRDRLQADRGKIQTEIAPLREFTLAEDYHQKYELRNNRELMKEFQAIYPADSEFVRSTAAARVNALIGGHGSVAGLKAELTRLGLPEDSVKRIVSRLQ